MARAYPRSSGVAAAAAAAGGTCQGAANEVVAIHWKGIVGAAGAVVCGDPLSNALGPLREAPPPSSTMF